MVILKRRIVFTMYTSKLRVKLAYFRAKTVHDNYFIYGVNISNPRSVNHVEIVLHN